MRSSEASVCGIVVSFQPELGGLQKLLDSLLGQVDWVVIVDNGSVNDIEAWANEKFPGAPQLKVIPLGTNRGIATAQNVGISWARQNHASHVVLFDQDSEPAADMIAQLLGAANKKLAQGVRLAAVGPRFQDDRQDNPPPFTRIKGLKMERQACSLPNSVVEVDYLIASGCLIPMSTLDAVGGMQEELFIDYVDIEWGLRAKMRGYQSFGVCSAYMSHDLGDEPIEFLGRKLPLHSPLRHYYHLRNALWLYRQNWLPLHWKLADGWRLLLKYGFYSLFAKPRHRHWWMMTKGIIHGLTGRMGRLN